jgi:hypothetical protein
MADRPETFTARHPAWLPTLPPADASTLPAILDKQPIVVLHCWAEWNRVDRLMDTLLQEIIAPFADRVAFYSFDTTPQEGWPFLIEWQALNLPALVCFVDGHHHETQIGLLPKPEMEAKLQEWFAASPHKLGTETRHLTPET